jgi:hypothetical protein
MYWDKFDEWIKRAAYATVFDNIKQGHLTKL